MNRKKIMPFVIGAVVLLVGYVAISKILFAFSHENTENAQLETNLVAVAPKVGGYITAVLVKENQLVKAGDTLALIDDRDLKIRVLQAEIALKNAEANVALIQANTKAASANVSTSDASYQASNAAIATANAGVETAKAQVEAAKIRVWKATSDYNRANALYKEKALTLQQLEAAKAEKEAAEAALTVAAKQVEASQIQVNAVSKNANIGDKQKTAAQIQANAVEKQIALAQTQVELRRAELELARLQLSFAAVTAPIGGYVSKKNMQVGQLVAVGAPLLTLVDNSQFWITANFKETQVAEMKAGQKVEIKVDAYKDARFEGEIESFAGATGAKFSLLPPDNASGNFVKVVQRIPVRIALSNNQPADKPLRAGMSVEVVVPIK